LNGPYDFLCYTLDLGQVSLRGVQGRLRRQL